MTCQPVNVGEQQQEISQMAGENGINGYREHLRESVNRRDSIHKLKTCYEFEAKDLEFDCIGDTFCSTSEVSPVKITIPAQDTVLLTGLQSNNQVLIHRRNEDNQSALEEKYSPLHQRVLVSNNSYKLQQVESVMLKKPTPPDRQLSHDNNSNQESSRFKDDKNIPMKKRIVIDQESQNMSSPQHVGSPQGAYPQSRSPPTFLRHSPPHSFISQQAFTQSGGIPNIGSGPPPIMSQGQSFIRNPGAPPMHAGLLQGVPSASGYRDRFQDSWGYFPLQKRQKFGLQGNGNNKEAVPLDLIKQS